MYSALCSGVWQGQGGSRVLRKQQLELEGPWPPQPSEQQQDLAFLPGRQDIHSTYWRCLVLGLLAILPLY